MLGYGVAPKSDFWVADGDPTAKLHIAFRVHDRRSVDSFYQAALAAGGTGCSR